MAATNFFTKAIYKRYADKLEKEILSEPMPKHIAIIMDGNRRYAEEVLKKPINEGHVAGRRKLEEVLDWCKKLDIKILTVFAFSTENFSRDKDEIDFLMDLFESVLIELADDEEVHKNRMRLTAIGDRSMLPKNVVDAIEYAENRTSAYNDMTLNMAIAYGGRQEIAMAVKDIAAKVKAGVMEVDDIDVDMISDHMYTCDMPDPDLVLRTSGEMRVSNFLLWQLAYSEFYFTDVYWPGFRYIDFMRAIRAYQQRTRRYGR